VYVDITLDRPRKLRFDIASLLTLEQLMDGKPLGSIVSDLQRTSITGICLGLFAGLRHEDKALTRQSVQQLVEDYLNGAATSSS
jgi:hypothetical protein